MKNKKELLGIETNDLLVKTLSTMIKIMEQIKTGLKSKSITMGESDDFIKRIFELWEEMVWFIVKC